MHLPTPGLPHTASGLVVQLRDGSEIYIRPITPADAAGLIEFHGRLSPESIRLRFFSPHPRLSSAEVDRFTNVDHTKRDALVAVHDDTIVGVGRYEGSAGSAEAEVAFVVADAWHHRGVATALLREVAAHARAAGLRRLVADTLAENHPMIDVFEHSGLPLVRTYDGSTIHYSMSLVDAAAT
ncbi:MAG TPA: GNAT family N-acetyltransferase [Microthrixaceae bacterium]|nr:GNAT family N-acetyltransferase [Microthrixaceae bacterium]